MRGRVSGWVRMSSGNSGLKCGYVLHSCLGPEREGDGHPGVSPLAWR